MLRCNGYKAQLRLFGCSLLALSLIGCQRSPRANSSPAGAPEAELATLVDQVLQLASKTRVSAQRHTPWELVHALLGMGPNALMRDQSLPEEITLLQYFQNGGSWHGRPLYIPKSGGLEVNRSSYPGELETHTDQFLAYFALARIPLKTKIWVNGQSHELSDILNRSKERFSSTKETTFTLIALVGFEGIDSAWRNELGQQFSVRDLTALELDSDRSRLACGGTHSLLALANAYSLALQLGEADRWIWPKVSSRLQEARIRVREAQLESGAFPPSLMLSNSRELLPIHEENGTIYSTGHHLEWIVASAHGEELTAPWIRNAIAFLCKALIRRQFDPAPASPWYHALHAVRVYHERLRSE